MIEFELHGSYKADQLPADQLAYLALMDISFTIGSDIHAITWIPKEQWVWTRALGDGSCDELKFYELSDLIRELTGYFKALNYN